MLNSLLITDNINLVKELLDEIRIHDLNIKVGGLGTTKFEALTLLKEPDFDLVFLDKSLENDYSRALLRTYKRNILVISFDENNILLNTKYIKTLKRLINNYDIDIRRKKVIEELEFIGYKFKYKGTHYLVDAIMMMFSDQDSMVDNLQTTVYPIIARKYKKSIINVKSSINKATEYMYCECDSQKLAKYFRFSLDAKPTVKQVVFTVVSKVYV